MLDELEIHVHSMAFQDTNQLVPAWWDEYWNSILHHLCKPVLPSHLTVLTWPKMRLTGSGTELITILRCVLLFKTVVTSRKVIVFKIKFSLQKNDHLSRVCSLVPRPDSWHKHNCTQKACFTMDRIYQVYTRYILDIYHAKVTCKPA